MNGRSNQGGSVASFIIIGVVLVIMTTGVLYWVRHKDAPIARESPTPEVTLPGDETKTDESKDQAKPNEEPNKEDTASPSEEATTPDAAPSTDTAPAPQTESTTTLPTTGPADTAVQMIAIGALAIAGIGFIRSRNHATSL